MEPAAKKLCQTVSTAARNAKKIVVEGNIAAGKSTFLEIIKRHDDKFRVVSEPITKWTNVPPVEDEQSSSQRCGSNLLDLSYQDPKRWAYTFQTYAFLSRLRAQLHDGIPTDIESASVIFYERSVHSDKLCFAETLHDIQSINDTEWQVYCEWHKFLTTHLPLKFDGIIYLQARPEVCMARMKQRNRSEEQGVDLDYLTRLHVKHEDWLAHGKANPHGDAPVLMVDCSEEFATDEKRKAEILEQVDEFLSKLDS